MPNAYNYGFCGGIDGMWKVLKLPKRSAADSRAYRNTEFHRNYYTHRQETQADFSQGN